MTRKHKLLLCSEFSTTIFLFFIILALSLTNIWMKTLLSFVFASGITIPIYWKYRFKHAEKEEKQLMISQKKINHYYYNRWYIPADSTELDYQIERIKKRKNQLTRSNQKNKNTNKLKIKR
jgi:hypothetical protein